MPDTEVPLLKAWLTAAGGNAATGGDTEVPILKSLYTRLGGTGEMPDTEVPLLRGISSLTSVVDITTGLIMWLKMDEGIGDPQDSTVNGHNGTLSGSPVWTSPGYTGASALTFDGINDLVSLSSFGSGTTWTFACWLKPNSATLDFGTLLTDAAQATGIWYRGSGGASNLKFSFYGGTERVSTIALTNAAWNHIVLVNNAGTLTFYVNGVAAGSFAGGAAITVQRIGGAGTNFLKGDLTDVRLWSIALNESQIEAVYSTFTSLVTLTNGTISFTSWTAITGLSFPALTGVVGAGSEIAFDSCNAATSFSAPLLTSCAGFLSVQKLPSLTSINLGALATASKLYFNFIGVTSLSLPAYSGNIGYLEILDNYNLTTVNLGGLATPTNYMEIGNNSVLVTLTANSFNASSGAAVFWSIYNNPLLATLTLPGLTTIACIIEFTTLPSLTTLSMANLSSIAAGAGIGAANSAALRNITVSGTIATGEMAGVDFSGANLSAASVNALLIAFNAGKTNPVLTSPVIALNGGTSAAPTGAGITAKNALIAAGYNVLVNP